LDVANPELYCNVFCEMLKDNSHCDIEGRCLDFHSKVEVRDAKARWVRQLFVEDEST
jgi:hypothetical protein